MKISTVARLSFISVVVVYILYGIIHKVNDYLYEEHLEVVRPVVEQSVEVPEIDNDISVAVEIETEYQQQLSCLTLNIYHEARSESKLGQEAVGLVTMNRVYDGRYPDTVCDVVYQSHVDSKGRPKRNRCQFSWYCDGKSDKIHDIVAYNEIEELSASILESYGIERDITDGAVMYHASYVKPYWASSYERTSRVDSHIFYK
ncbi:cell wall hydrolase [Porticoccaceae bacterium]|nr:cell wall hydrolase [Porticoccaceae bacterium]MDB4559083.1 cell wall hydrolase [bacterium]